MSHFQHHSLKASILRHSAFFIVQLSHPYMIIGETIALTLGDFVGKVMSLLFNTIFGGSKITADGECSHGIKIHLFLGRKAVNNLDSILKSRDITLPTKVHLVKAMVFPIIMYGCESWTIKKA